MASNSELTVNDLILQYGLSQTVLGKQCTDNLVLKIAEFFKEWEVVAPLLGVNADEVKACESKPILQRRKCLQLWIQKFAFKATYVRLLNILLKSKYANTACQICKLLKQDVISDPFSEPIPQKSKKRPLTIPKKYKKYTTPPGSPPQRMTSPTSLTSSPTTSLPHPSTTYGTLSSANLCLSNPSNYHSTPPPYHLQPSSSFDDVGPSESVEHAKIEEITGYSIDVNKRKDDLYEKFIAIIKEVKEYLASHQIKLEDVIESLTAPPHDLRRPLAALIENREELLDIKSSEKLFNYLGKYWNEMNPMLLIHLIKMLKNETLMKNINVYEEELDRFRKITTLNEIATEGIRTGYPGGQNVKFQLPSNRFNFPLSHPIMLIGQFERVTGCGGPVCFTGVQISSVYITFIVPLPLDPEIFDRKEVQDFLHSFDILSVSIDERCVFQLPRYETLETEKKERDVLFALQKKSKTTSASVIPPEAGSRSYRDEEYMIIISDGNINPDGVSVAKRQVDETFVSGNKNILNIQGLSQSAALDLKTVADNITLSDHKELTSLKLDITGKERSKDYYRKAVEKFLNDCKRSGHGAYIWYMGHSEEHTGNWCFKDGTISFEEIFGIYKQIQEHKDLPESLLVVFSDCSYSGNWVHRCAEIMDKEKILPCGHQSYRRSLLVRVHCSAEPDQEAHALYYSTKGIKTNKQDGEFSHQDIPLSPSQNPYSGDFTKLVCLRGPEEKCRMDEDIKDWRWTDVITGKLRKSIYIFEESRNNQKRWYTILLFNRGTEFIKSYEAEVKKKRAIDTADWGYVLQSGLGETPPKSILRKLAYL